MKPQNMNIRPAFSLLKMSDVISFYHLQMPRWLFSRGKYKALPLEAKVAYTFLLNRFQLSRMNGWENEDGEVFVIFTREELAGEMQISYKKAIESFKSLSEAKLIWEHRLGRGHANRIYLAQVALPDQQVSEHTSAPFTPKARPTKSAVLDNACENSNELRCAETAPLGENEICQNGMSKPAKSAFVDLPKQHRSKKDRDISIREMSDSELSQLDVVLKKCEMHLFTQEAETSFTLAIERLFFIQQFKIGNSLIPNAVVRRTLMRLNGSILQTVQDKLMQNTEPIKNPTAYIMAVIFNEILESDAGLLIDPDLNSIRLGGVIKC